MPQGTCEVRRLADLPPGYSIKRRDTWTHLAGTYDGTYLKLYVDGSLANQVSYNLGVFNSTDGLAIGGTIGRVGVDSPVYLFDGRMDFVRLYRRALTSTEVQVLHDNNQ